MAYILTFIFIYSCMLSKESLRLLHSLLMIITRFRAIYQHMTYHSIYYQTNQNGVIILDLKLKQTHLDEYLGMVDECLLMLSIHITTMIFPDKMTMTSIESMTMIIESMSHNTWLPNLLTLLSYSCRIDIDYMIFFTNIVIIFNLNIFLIYLTLNVLYVYILIS